MRHERQKNKKFRSFFIENYFFRIGFKPKIFIKVELSSEHQEEKKMKESKRKRKRKKFLFYFYLPRIVSILRILFILKCFLYFLYKTIFFPYLY